jgi:glycosyltransferase involved in cell wall biosynthesis
LPDALKVPNVHGECPSDRSDHVRHALEQLHSRFHFGVIVLPTVGGLGFRTIQARQAGSSFRDVPVVVCLDASSAYLREQQERWPDSLDELEMDYIERRSFEQADVQLAASQKVLEHARAAGWSVRPDISLVSVNDLASALDRGVTVRTHATSGATGRPLVTVCVPHFNLGEHLPRTLESLAAQTYPHLEVLVIDDGSTDRASRSVFQAMQQEYPRFHFLTQANAGIGATRNRALAEARGSYFVPVDADNVARPEMIERLVQGIHHRPELGALTCYFLAFEEDADLQRGRYAYAYRATGGPHVLASMRNVYGDATAIYRAEALRAIGGYETDRGTSFEDWEVFVKLVQAGYQVDVLPEHLFYYRYRRAGFSRLTRQYANHERVLRQFRRVEGLPPAERVLLWNALAGFHRRLDHLQAQQRSLRYRLADRLYSACRRVPIVTRSLKWLLGLL